ncbi:DUF7674 family protein [Chryseobacterium daeguense]|uniref:DUF7674 family protein n=1 Tax=Chryseobacterium daeguense TaxID=412438 RepID=UPI0004001DF9|nr:hypothetical protein [Chryseobacterium daeguense]
MNKINEEKAIEYIKQFFPKMESEISKLSGEHNFGGVLQLMVDRIKCLLDESKLFEITEVIKKTEWIYKNGNAYVRYMIENIFILCFNSLKKRAQPQQWKIIHQEIGSDFLCVYKQLAQNNKTINSLYQ